jgi:hypothetical protein
VVAGVCTLLMRPRRLVRAAIVLKPSTLLRLHRALTTRKYRRLFSSTVSKKPGPKGPSREVIAAVVDMKQRNPTWGCPRIAQHIASHPFVERLIGTIRRECVDRTLFWTAADLETKLFEFQRSYNGHRAHAGLEGRPPESVLTEPAWNPYCELFSSFRHPLLLTIGNSPPTRQNLNKAVTRKFCGAWKLPRAVAVPNVVRAV